MPQNKEINVYTYDEFADQVLRKLDEKFNSPSNLKKGDKYFSQKPFINVINNHNIDAKDYFNNIKYIKYPSNLHNLNFSIQHSYDQYKKDLDKRNIAEAANNLFKFFNINDIIEARYLSAISGEPLAGKQYSLDEVNRWMKNNYDNMKFRDEIEAFTKDSVAKTSVNAYIAVLPYIKEEVDNQHSLDSGKKVSKEEFRDLVEKELEKRSDFDKLPSSFYMYFDGPISTSVKNIIQDYEAGNKNALFKYLIIPDDSSEYNTKNVCHEANKMMGIDRLYGGKEMFDNLFLDDNIMNGKYAAAIMGVPFAGKISTVEEINKDIFENLYKFGGEYMGTCTDASHRVIPAEELFKDFKERIEATLQDMVDLQKEYQQSKEKSNAIDNEETLDDIIAAAEADAEKETTRSNRQIETEMELD